jgi:hypothetical protein
MGLIRRQKRQAFFLRGILPCLAAIFLSGVLHAQDSGTGLAAEIRSIESALAAAPANSPSSRQTAQQRQDTFARLARLQQLSGDIEAASKSWLYAAEIGQGGEKDASLVAGAFCLAAMGEWEKAQAAINGLLFESKPGETLKQAQYLEACAKAWLSSDVSGLVSIANNPVCGQIRSAAYYTLWKLAEGRPETSGIGAAAEWKSRLLAEFPQSPEGRIAASEGSSPNAAMVSVKPSPLWLLLPASNIAPYTASTQVPALASSALTGGPVTGNGVTDAARATTPAATSASATSTLAPSPPASAPGPASPPAPSSRILQTGLFSDEANARKRAEQLKATGFTPSINRRYVNGKDHWSVTVPAGTNMNQTIQELKKAGFDSFPLD